MRKVLVTGADGFIGSHLTELLVTKGYDVTALVQYNSFNSWGWLDESEVKNKVRIVAGDIRDGFFCDELVKGQDVVFHLAALIAIPYSYQAPESYVETNVKGTLNICQAAVKAGVKRIVHTSTSEVYGSAKYVPIDELHPLQPQSPYSASKIAADAMAMSFYNAFELPLTIARPFNTYGPRQSARAVIPTIITQIASGARQIKLGDLSPTRDFNYVSDTCAGFISLADCEEAIGKTVNIGSGEEISVRDTLNLIRELMNSDVEFLVEDERLRPERSEVQRLCCNSSLLRELTGHRHAVTLREGLARTVDWFVLPEHLRRYKSDLYNV